LRTGKLPPELLRELLRSDAPVPSELRLGPAVGEDACAVDVPAGTLVAATDPITLTGSEVGSFAVTINANDVAVMGVRPRWFMAAVLLPVGSTEQDVRALFGSMRGALQRTGAVLVGGHTEVTDAVRQPVVVGQMMGLSEDRRIVRTGGARVGDVIVQVGPAPVEAAAVLAETAAERGGVDSDLLERARRADLEPGISVVDAALAAAECGACSLHDPTEGGLATGLREVADASGVEIRVDTDLVHWFEPGLAVCEAVGADPWGALASGALIAAFADEDAERACATLQAAGFDARSIGVARGGSGICSVNGDAIADFDRDEVARVFDADAGE
jgi:hydrogenase maturation factor